MGKVIPFNRSRRVSGLKNFALDYDQNPKERFLDAGVIPCFIFILLCIVLGPIFYSTIFAGSILTGIGAGIVKYRFFPYKTQSLGDLTVLYTEAPIKISKTKKAA